jgi:hypothetical protein
MLNQHFLKRLFYFVLIIAFGAIITLVISHIQEKEQNAARANASGLRVDSWP